jgi:hypothetical protein
VNRRVHRLVHRLVHSRVGQAPQPSTRLVRGTFGHKAGKLEGPGLKGTRLGGLPRKQEVLGTVSPHSTGSRNIRAKVGHGCGVEAGVRGTEGSLVRVWVGMERLSRNPITNPGSLPWGYWTRAWLFSPACSWHGLTGEGARVGSTNSLTRVGWRGDRSP